MRRFLTDWGEIQLHLAFIYEIMGEKKINCATQNAYMPTFHPRKRGTHP